MKSVVKKSLFNKSLLSLCLLLSTCITNAATDDPQALFNTINQRLGYMQDVALYKAQNQLAIENNQREVTVLQNAKNTAAAKGLDAQRVEAFFIAQISAAKAIQYRYRADLLSQPIERLPLDLNKHIRPALITLGNKIIEQMATYIAANGGFKTSQRELFFSIVKRRYLSETDKQRLFEGLLQVK